MRGWCGRAASGLTRAQAVAPHVHHTYHCPCDTCQRRLLAPPTTRLPPPVLAVAAGCPPSSPRSLDAQAASRSVTSSLPPSTPALKGQAGANFDRKVVFCCPFRPEPPFPQSCLGISAYTNRAIQHCETGAPAWAHLFAAPVQVSERVLSSQCLCPVNFSVDPVVITEEVAAVAAVRLAAQPLWCWPLVCASAEWCSTPHGSRDSAEKCGSKAVS